jgi:hypothetical protein
MATGRTVQRWARVYVDGYDMSGYARSLSPLNWTFDEADLTAIGDSVKGFLPSQVNLGVGTINANLDNTATSGSHVVLSSSGVSRNVMIALGMRAVPAAGDPVYMGRFQQQAYQAAEDGGAMTVSIVFDDYDAANQINYVKPWGELLHAAGAETAVNAGAGVDGLAASAFGGYLMYQVLAGDGTATIKVQDSANNSTWLDLTGATSGVIDCSSPSAAIVQLGKTATVRQYLRWQIVLGTATTVTFALAFVRANY